MKLPGVGRYITGCVLIHAFGQSAPVVDTNIERVLSRVFGLSNGQDVWRIYFAIAPPKGARGFHLALLDLANLLCRPKEPECQACPIRSCCEYAAQHPDESDETPTL
jgi:A/G-specific adenine glycosylase